jgi:hypothetical protein
MRALSIRQPWAHAILHAGKRIENRTWPTSFRGWFFIHASKACGKDEMLDAIESIREVLTHPVARERVCHLAGLEPGALAICAGAFMSAPRGGIVGKARLVDVLPPTENPTDPWHVPGQFGFVLEDVQEVPFRALRGALGFFEVPT